MTEDIYNLIFVMAGLVPAAATGPTRMISELLIQADPFWLGLMLASHLGAALAGALVAWVIRGALKRCA